MSTYAGNWNTFQAVKLFFIKKKALTKAVNEIKLEKLNVGLIITNPNGGRLFSNEEIDQRMNLIKRNNIKGVSMWRTHDLFNRTNYWWRKFEEFHL
jgi:hypothetical protein